MTRMSAVAATFALTTALVNPVAAETELTMYYPIAVGGKLTEVVDGIVADFEAQNPDIKVNAIYAGNYDDTRIKSLAALEAGEPAQLAVMFSIDAYDLIEQDLIVPFDDLIDGAEEENLAEQFLPRADGQWQNRRQDLGCTVPALDHRGLLQQRHVPRRRSGCRQGTCHLGGAGVDGQGPDQ